MPPGIRLIVFDCDGVLIDSRRANEAYYNHILAHFGRPPPTPAQLDKAHSLTAAQAIDLLFQGSPWLNEAQAYQLTMDNRPYLPLLAAEPHIAATLKRLRPDYHTAIATNRGKSLPLVLAQTGLAGLFDLTVSSLDVSHPKPHPDGLKRILAHFRLPPEAALYIGDSEVDREFAARAGAPFAAYKNPRLKARWHLDDHRQLLDILSHPAAAP